MTLVLYPLLVALLTVADGTSYATENVFAGRFRYTSELAKLGAKIPKVRREGGTK